MAGALVRGAGWVLKNLFTKAAANGGRSLSILRTGATVAATTGALAYREEIGDSLRDAVADPFATAVAAKDGIEDFGSNMTNFADGARSTFEGGIEQIDNARDFMEDPAGSVLNNAFGSNADGQKGWSGWDIAKTGGLVGIGAWLLSKVFGGNKGDEQNGNGLGFGSMLKVGALALGGWLLFQNRDLIQDKASDLLGGNNRGGGSSGTNALNPDEYSLDADF